MILPTPPPQRGNYPVDGRSVVSIDKCSFLSWFCARFCFVMNDVCLILCSIVCGREREKKATIWCPWFFLEERYRAWKIFKVRMTAKYVLAFLSESLFHVKFDILKLGLLNVCYGKRYFLCYCYHYHYCCTYFIYSFLTYRWR